MRSIIEELWYGNVSYGSECRKPTSEANELIGYITNHHEKLQKTLTKEQKEILERFDDCLTELTDINEREIFVYAFRLGMKIAIEVMNFSVE